jgi:hypothetical protein
MAADDRYETTSGTSGWTRFVCPVCDEASILDLPDHPRFFFPCSTCHPELPLVDGDFLDGDYVVGPPV